MNKWRKESETAEASILYLLGPTWLEKKLTIKIKKDKRTLGFGLFFSCNCPSRTKQDRHTANEYELKTQTYCVPSPHTHPQYHPDPRPSPSFLGCRGGSSRTLPSTPCTPVGRARALGVRPCCRAASSPPINYVPLTQTLILTLRLTLANTATLSPCLVQVLVSTTWCRQKPEVTRA